LTSKSPSPRAFHTATLLTDGRVLIAGGVGTNGRISKRIDLYDPRQKNVSRATGELASARQNHAATLLSDGRVLFTGGNNDSRNALSIPEVFDPQSQSVSLISDPQPLLATSTGLAESAATSPEDGAADVPIDTLVSMRFNRPIQIATITDQTVVLSGPSGVVDAKIAGAESGMLAFITPRNALVPGTTYSVRFSGALDTNNANVAFTEFMFTTAADHSQDDLWTPSPDWMTHNPASKWQSMPPLQAAPGVTALAGQVLKLDGTPLPRVKLQIGTQQAISDGTGRFLLSGLAAGHHAMMILGETANTPTRKYGVFEVGVNIQAQVTNVLRYTIWM